MAAPLGNMNVPGGGGGAVNNILPPDELLRILDYRLFEADNHIRQLQGQREQLERGVADRDHLLHNYLLPGLLQAESTISLSIKLQASGNGFDQETASSVAALVTVQQLLQELLRNGYGIRLFDSAVASPGCIHVFLDYLTEGTKSDSGAQLLSDFAELACNLLYAIQYTHASLQFGPLQLNDLQPDSRGAKWELIDDAKKIEVQSVRRQGSRVKIAGANLAGGLLPPATIYVREGGKLQCIIPQEASQVYRAAEDIKGNQDGEVSELEFQLDHMGSRTERTLEVVRHAYRGAVTLGVQKSEQVRAAAPAGEDIATRDLQQRSTVTEADLFADQGKPEQQLPSFSSGAQEINADRDDPDVHPLVELKDLPVPHGSQSSHATSLSMTSSMHLAVTLHDALQLCIPKYRSFMGLSKLSCYVVMKVGSETRRSKICKGDGYAIFTEDFHFEVDGNLDLVVEVFHKSTLWGSVLIGKGKLAMSQILAMNNREIIVRLVPSGKLRLYTHLSLPRAITEKRVKNNDGWQTEDRQMVTDSAKSSRRIEGVQRRPWLLTRLLQRPGDSARAKVLESLLEDAQDWLIPSNMLSTSESVSDPIKLYSANLGEGSQGVYGESANVYIMSLKHDKEEGLEAALHTVNTLKRLHHPSILQFLGACVTDASVQLVTELIAGNLYDALQDGRFTWHDGGKRVAQSIAGALAYMHRKGMVHLDVKAANVLLTSHNEAKLRGVGIRDLGRIEILIQYMSTTMDSRPRDTPELLMGWTPVTPASDVYSFGVLLWEICSGKAAQPLQLLGISEISRDFKDIPDELVALIRQCLDPSPWDRPTMEEVNRRLMKL